MVRTKKSASKPVAITVETPHKYSVDINMGGIKEKQTGATIFEALSKLKMNKVVGKVQATFSNGVKSHTMYFLRPIFFRRVLASNSVKIILEKRAKLFLGEK